MGTMYSYYMESGIPLIKQWLRDVGVIAGKRVSKNTNQEVVRRYREL
jgi:hypothetical protein